MTPTALTTTQLLQLLGVAAALVTILYLIETRRRRVRVPYGPVWAMVLTSREASSLWRYLKRLFSWLVAMSVAGLLVFGAADPRPRREQEEGRSLVLLLDTSASMSATDIPGGRMAAARVLALQEVERLTPADSMMLLTVDQQVTPLVSFTSDPAVLRHALQEVRTSATRADWARAFRFARTALRGRARGELVLITDAAFAPDVQLPTGGPPFRLLPVGQPGQGNNVAILAFNARRYPADRTSYELFLRVKSTFDKPIRCSLHIQANGVLVETIQLSLAPGEAQIRVFPDLPVIGGRLVATLVFPPDVVDQLALDNQAYALLPEQRELQVVLVTPGNLFLEAALLLDSQLRLTRLTPAAYRELSTAPAQDVVILDRTAPRPDQRGPQVLIAPGEGSPWRIKGRIARPVVSFVQKDSPLLRWVTFNDLNLQEADRVEAQPQAGDRVLVASSQGPLLLIREEPDSPRVLFTFDPLRSDLPLRTAFPMLLLNIFDWFFHHDAELLATYHTGESWRVSLPSRSGARPEISPVGSPPGSAGVSASARTADPQVAVGGAIDQVSWIQPDGTETRLPAPGGQVTLRGTQPGFHILRRVAPGEADPPEPERLLAANFTDAQESDTRPRAEVLAAVAQAHSQAPVQLPTSGSRRPLWILLVWIAGAILLVEWSTYHRRITV